MAIVVYRDNDSLSVFFERGIVGAWPLNALQAIGDGSGGVSVRNKAKSYPDGSDFFEIASAPFAEFEDQSGTAYGATETDTVNALNAAFATCMAHTADAKTSVTSVQELHAQVKASQA